MSTDCKSQSPLNLLMHATLIIFFLLAMFVLLPTRVVQASTWTVCVSNCDYTTIKLAIQNENTFDGDTLLISDTVHTESSVTISKTLTIEGLGRDLTIWQAAESPSANNNYLLHSNSGKIVTLRNMTLRHGGSIGSYYGAISLYGPATLENLLVTKNLTNKVSNAQGGAIFTQDPMTVTYCIISENIASSDYLASGGGIFSTSGFLIIKNSSIINNQALGNFKTTGPGIQAQGGGVATLNPAQIENSTISGNLTRGGDVTSGSGGAAFGGGINWGVFSVPITITNSTISDNSAIAGSGESIGSAAGGGIYMYLGTLNFVTVYSNTVSGNLAKGGGLYSSGSSSTKPIIQNSIFAYNSGTTNENGLELYGYIRSQDYNLIEHSMGYTMTGTTTHNIYGVDPRLDPLTDNGGDTLTHAPRPDSAVINAIPSGSNGCIPGSTIDQTGKGRPTNVACEIGAFETPWKLYLPVVYR